MECDRCKGVLGDSRECIDCLTTCLCCGGWGAHESIDPCDPPGNDCVMCNNTGRRPAPTAKEAERE